MEKYLITGFSGFVSQHFLEYLEENRIRSQVLGVDLLSPGFNIRSFEFVQCSFEKIDLLDRNQVDNLVYQFQPDYILHLASFSSVAYGWKNPVTSFQNNTNIFLNLLEKVRALDLQCRILSIGSSEEYGNVPEKDLPLREEHGLKPVSPYAVARVAQEMLSRVYVEGYGLDIVMTRSFNHIGPRQRDVFAVPSFARQMVQMKRSGEKSGKLVAGDVEIVRDFLDVRDVVAAYHALFKKGERGAVYNVCSGSGVRLKEVIDRLAVILGLKVEVSTSDLLIRPSDNRILIGSNEKLRKATGWTAAYPIDRSLGDIVRHWEAVL
jgi:GDP-4-dehydro-6-deoxy-D-mannose reductase